MVIQGPPMKAELAVHGSTADQLRAFASEAFDLLFGQDRWTLTDSKAEVDVNVVDGQPLMWIGSFIAVELDNAPERPPSKPVMGE